MLSPAITQVSPSLSANAGSTAKDWPHEEARIERTSNVVFTKMTNPKKPQKFQFLVSLFYEADSGKLDAALDTDAHTLTLLRR